MSSPFQMIVTVNPVDVNNLFNKLEVLLSDNSMEGFLLTRTSSYIQDRMRSRFAAEGDDVTNGPWQPLQASTERIRQSLGYPGPHPINVRTGDLEAFLVSDSGVMTGAATWTYPSPGAPSDIQEKIQTAQQGKGFPPTVPRPVIGIGPTDEADIVEDLEEFIRQGLI